VSGAVDPGWWADLRSSALVGTARRPVPDLAPALGVAGRTEAPEPADLAPSTVALLDAAALGGAARSGGRVALAVPDGRVPRFAPDDDAVEASPTATQLLELLLGPAPPGGAHRNDLVEHWFRTAAATGHRVPAPLLVPVIAHATAVQPLRPAAAAAIGARGRWLGRANPDWSWAAADPDGTPGGDGSIAPDGWALLPSADRVEVLRTLRRRDPTAARELLASTWATDAATARAAHLAALADGLGPDDEPLLEEALDDRAKGVRQQAATLLDGLDGSARSARLAERLRALVTGSGRGGRLAVALPDDPDPAGARDGLVPPPSGRSARGFWLEALVAGAPLSLWTEATGADVAGTVDVLVASGDDVPADVRAGLVRATLARRDPAWAAALHRWTPDPRLLDVLPPADRTARILEVLGAASVPTGVHLAALLDHLPAPWSVEASALILRVLRADAHAATTVTGSLPAIATALHPTVRAEVDAWLGGLEEQPKLAAALRNLVQYSSLHRSITEAFR
jgi:hypothetical protein